jgi:hypothetical protein
MNRILVGLLIVAFSAIGIIPSQSQAAEGALIQFRTGEINGDWNTVFGPDGKPVPDSSYMMLMLAGPNGVVDPPKCDGSPGGDDIQPTSNTFNCLYVHDVNKELPITPPGNIFAPGIALNALPEGRLEEPAVNLGDKIYFRVFNAKVPSQATHYNDMISVDGRPMTVYEIPTIDGLALYTVILAFGPAKPLCPEGKK